ncbi:MAG: hypothetical protein QOG59_1538 [Solirubrobacteraceae bacterium]|jgi:hypothetical protein|nr:hypothetical protein [Solirubrobacteraceae bacterium]
MRKTSLIATTLTLALAGPSVSVATASPFRDPIAHAAGLVVSLNPIAHAAGTVVDQPGHYVDPLGHHRGKHYVDPLGTGTPGTPAPGTPHPGYAYGKACANESHVRVEGKPGTPFSECVHALKMLAGGTSHSAAAACKRESHRHVKGKKGTPFSRCVADAHRLMHAKRTHSRRPVTGPR